MAPVPYSASHQLDIHYTVASQPHVVQIPCSAIPVSGNYELELWDGGSRLASACADDYAQLVKIFFNPGDSFTQYVVQQYSDGIFIPIESASMSVAGTDGSNPTLLGFQDTLTFRDTNYGFVRHVIEESTLPGPKKYGYPVSGLTGYNALIESMLPTSVATNPLNEWMRSRGNFRLQTHVKTSVNTNKRLLRNRGL